MRKGIAIKISKQEQDALITSGDLKTLTCEMELLIKMMIDKYKILPRDRSHILKMLREAILYSSHLYLKNKRNEQRGYNFATYYTWFVRQILEEYEKVGYVAAQDLHDHALLKYYDGIRK